MAGGVLKFDGGYLGIERCQNPVDGKEYLRAVIYNSARGLQTSAAVEISAVFGFATQIVKQALLADGHSETEIADLTWSSRAMSQ